jgi:hypothetical protein
MRARLGRFLLVVIALLCGLGFCIWQYLDHRQFSPIAWQEAKPGRRYNLALDLIQKGEIEKWSRDEVRANLGSPSSSEANEIWLYFLGPKHDSWLAIDTDWLEVRFDVSGHMVDAVIRSMDG